MATGKYSYTKLIANKKKDGLFGPRHFVNTKYPEIPLSNTDIYVFANAGDRFDTLAQQYYENSSYWWIISIANDFLRQDSYFLPLNQQIRIPQDIGPILSAFNQLNNV